MRIFIAALLVAINYAQTGWDTWEHCADNGDWCSCPGYMRFHGVDNTYSEPIYINGMKLCSNSDFLTPSCECREDVFKVITGFEACEVNNSGCVTGRSTRNRDHTVGCMVAIMKSGILRVEEFNMGKSELTVRKYRSFSGRGFSGTVGPDGVEVKAKDRIGFDPDFSNKMSDFTICLEIPEENPDLGCGPGNPGPDACGVCGGSGFGPGACDCDGNVDAGCGCGLPGPSGCDNMCGSTAEEDECGVCGGSGIDPNACDCDGNVDAGCGCALPAPGCDNVCGSTMEEDECGICGGSGFAPGACDCDGNVDVGCGCGLPAPSGCDNVCGSTAEEDECGICGGNGFAPGACDCDGNVDAGCGCGLPGPSGCDNLCGSTMEEDECGICGGSGINDGFCDCDGNIDEGCGCGISCDAHFIIINDPGVESCTIDSNGCVTDGVGDYHNHEECEIRVNAAGTLAVSQFVVEQSSACKWDSLKVDGKKYCGTSSPDGVEVTEGSTIEWSSDRSITRAGWTICLIPDTSPTAEPSGLPTVEPTVNPTYNPTLQPTLEPTQIDLGCGPGNPGPDECGICGGSGIAPGACDCDGNVEAGCGCGLPGPSGCDNVCGSIAEEDICGVCGGNGFAPGACDCDGNIDAGCGCGLPGPSGCDNVCGSTMEDDVCGVCGGNGFAPGACDCDGNIDAGCGCGLPGPSGCDNACGSTAEEDVCGVCGGNGFVLGTCDCDGNVDAGCGCGLPGPSGCDNVCGSTAEEDVCGVCGGSGFAPGACDCDGNVDAGCGCGLPGPSGCDNVCGSTAEEDVCGVCGGSGFAPGACDCDGNVDAGCGCGLPRPSGCDNVCGSTLEEDECGICGGNGFAPGACDCDGNVDEGCGCGISCRLKNIGGNPSSALGVCEGDCDNDSDCVGDLKCFQRKLGAPGPIPGCIGTPKEDWDYCYVATGSIELSGGNDDGAKNLQACTGECDGDSQCAQGLKCFQRDNGETIPGCTGKGNGDNWDYCYDPQWTASLDGSVPIIAPPPVLIDVVIPEEYKLVDAKSDGWVKNRGCAAAGYKDIKSKAECGRAGVALGLELKSTTPTNSRYSRHGSNCFYRFGELYFNPASLRSDRDIYCGAFGRACVCKKTSSEKALAATLDQVVAKLVIDSRYLDFAVYIMAIVGAFSIIYYSATSMLNIFGRKTYTHIPGGEEAEV